MKIKFAFIKENNNLIKYILISFIFIIFSPINSKSQELDTLIINAINNNPEILALKEKIKSVEMKIPQSLSLEDPVLGFGTMNFPLNIPAFGEEMMTTYQLSLSQKVPLPEKLTLRSEVDKFALLTTKEELNNKINEIKLELKINYFNLYFINKSIQILEKNKSLMKNFIKIAESKYSVGKGLQQDVLNSYVELTKLNEKLIELNQNREELIYKINLLLNNPIKTNVETIVNLKINSLNITEEELLKKAISKNTSINNIKLLKLQNEIMKRLNELDFIPDFNFSLAYSMRKNRADLISGNVSVNLPLWYKTKENNKIQETNYKISEIDNKYKALINETIYKISSITLDLKKEAELYKLFNEGIIPQSEQALKSTISGYQVGKVDFMTLLNSQITLWNYEIQSFKKLTEYNKKIAKLEFVIGSELKEIFQSE